MPHSFAGSPEICLHGCMELAAVRIHGYSLALENADGFIGDTVSRTAFGRLLDAWRQLHASMDDRDPLGARATGDISRKRLDTMLDKNSRAAATIEAACEDYALQMADVIPQFLAHPSWRGVQRIVIGGGFPQSAVGERALLRTTELLAEARVDVQLTPLSHHADEGGLIGWVHAAPQSLLEPYKAFLAVDIGGTNVRCGIVHMHADRAPDLSGVEVIGRDKWGHADDEDATRREDLIAGVADMLKPLIRHAEKEKMRLAPFVGVACPGTVCPDGSIADGAQNLPGNWTSSRFNLPLELTKYLPRIDHRVPHVMLHNDAVIQGLSELPSMEDVRHWAVLTIGTGLGNASYTNR